MASLHVQPDHLIRSLQYTGEVGSVVGAGTQNDSDPCGIILVDLCAAEELGLPFELPGRGRHNAWRVREWRATQVSTRVERGTSSGLEDLEEVLSCVGGRDAELDRPSRHGVGQVKARVVHRHVDGRCLCHRRSSSLSNRRCGHETSNRTRRDRHLTGSSPIYLLHSLGTLSTTKWPGPSKPGPERVVLRLERPMPLEGAAKRSWTSGLKFAHDLGRSFLTLPGSDLAGVAAGSRAA